MMGLLGGEKMFDDMYSRSDRIPACDGRTDGQAEADGRISCHGIVCAMHSRRAVKLVTGL